MDCEAWEYGAAIGAAETVDWNWGAGGGPGGGEATSCLQMGSARVVAERGMMTFGVSEVGADMGVGVEKRLIS